MDYADRVMLSKAMVPGGGREVGRMEEGASSNKVCRDGVGGSPVRPDLEMILALWRLGTHLRAARAKVEAIGIFEYLGSSRTSPYHRRIQPQRS